MGRNRRPTAKPRPKSSKSSTIQKAASRLIPFPVDQQEPDDDYFHIIPKHLIRRIFCVLPSGQIGINTGNFLHFLKNGALKQVTDEKTLEKIHKHTRAPINPYQDAVEDLEIEWKKLHEQIGRCSNEADMKDLNERLEKIEADCAALIAERKQKQCFGNGDDEDRKEMMKIGH